MIGHCYSNQGVVARDTWCQSLGHYYANHIVVARDTCESWVITMATILWLSGIHDVNYGSLLWQLCCGFQGYMISIMGHYYGNHTVVVRDTWCQLWVITMATMLWLLAILNVNHWPIIFILTSLHPHLVYIAIRTFVTNGFHIWYESGWDFVCNHGNMFP